MSSPRNRSRLHRESDVVPKGTGAALEADAAEELAGLEPVPDAGLPAEAGDGSIDGVASEVIDPGETAAGEAAGAARDVAGDTERSAIKRALESLIFVSERVVTAAQLARATKTRAVLVRELVAELCEDYADRGIELIEVNGGYQFRSAPASAAYVREFVAQKPVRLTRAQLETLALIAYRQPVTRPEIDDIRGVDSGSALRVLLERGLIKMLGRKDEPGRPLLYGTAPEFLEFFGLRSLHELPTLREFTELSQENRALFKRKTGEDVADAEAELAAAEEAARAGEDDTGVHVSDEDLAALAEQAHADDTNAEAASREMRRHASGAEVEDGDGER